MYIEKRGSAALLCDLKTKVFDFGNPESIKNLTEVAVVYKHGHADLDIKISTNDGESFQQVGDLDDTGDDFDIFTNEFSLASNANFQGKKTFQVQITGTAHQKFELHSITFTYRDLGAH
tara:strand:- start:190 stop:546 length:357 start_codon:yes stop_codon:yes gene_type:complete